MSDIAFQKTAGGRRKTEFPRRPPGLLTPKRFWRWAKLIDCIGSDFGRFVAGVLLRPLSSVLCRPFSVLRQWWSQTGSNRRPHACKARALPTELWPRGREAARRKSELGKQKSEGRFPTSDFRLPAAKPLVGLGGLEPPTSRLSSARSNQLSYKPVSEDRGRKTDDRKGAFRPLSSVLRRPIKKRDEGGAVPQNAASTKPLDSEPNVKTCRHRRQRALAPSVLYVLMFADVRIQKGGDPAAGSPTATLLRLHPSR